MAATTFKLKEIIKLDDRAGFWQIYSISGKTYFLVPVTKDGKVKGAKYGIIGGKRCKIDKL